MILATILILSAPVALIYGWMYYMKRIKNQCAGWRDRITLSSLVLVSLAVLLWPVAAVFAPHYAGGMGYSRQVNYADGWRIVIFAMCAAATLLSLAGRPRLIVPIVVACCGTAFFWLFSMMP
jgi:hypothetical protein